MAEILYRTRRTASAGGGSAKSGVLPGRVAVALFEDLFGSFQLLGDLDQSRPFRRIKPGEDWRWSF